LEAHRREEEQGPQCADGALGMPRQNSGPTPPHELSNATSPLQTSDSDCPLHASDVGESQKRMPSLQAPHASPGKTSIPR
jgi:hypothetical protein